MEIVRDRQAWSCFSTVDEASASAPYSDVLGVKYAYDSTVANHKAIRAGDLVLIRDDTWVYGHGLVSKVVTEQGSKTMDFVQTVGPQGLTRGEASYRGTGARTASSNSMRR